MNFLIGLVRLAKLYPPEWNLASAGRPSRLIADDDVRCAAVLGSSTDHDTPGERDAGVIPHQACFVERLGHEMRRDPSRRIDVDRHRRYVLVWTHGGIGARLERQCERGGGNTRQHSAVIRRRVAAES